MTARFSLTTIVPVIGRHMAAKFGWDSRLHPRRLLAFTLDGDASLPPTPRPTVAQPVDVPEFALNEGLVRAGAVVYERCQWCHGIGAIAGGGAPDLRASAVPMNPAAFAAAVKIALAADTISITVMEIVDNAVMVGVPGAMHAGLANWIFWAALAFAFAVAFVVTLPVNKWLIGRGKGQAVVHEYHH